MANIEKDKPVVYMISGQIGSGKTTYAKKLEHKTGAIRFSPDEWMLKLYPELPSNNNFDFYYYRCCEVLWDISIKILQKGISVILDYGFWKLDDRETYRMKIEELGYCSKLFYVKCGYDTIKKRLHLRNEENILGAIKITDQDFTFFSPGFEPPAGNEEFILIDNT